MKIYKTVRHILGEDGVYHVVYDETTSDQVVHTDGTTAENHIDAEITSENGAHGFRYNRVESSFERFDKEQKKWVPLLMIDPLLLTEKREALCTRIGEGITIDRE